MEFGGAFEGGGEGPAADGEVGGDGELAVEVAGGVGLRGAEQGGGFGGCGAGGAEEDFDRLVGNRLTVGGGEAALQRNGLAAEDLMGSCGDDEAGGLPCFLALGGLCLCGRGWFVVDGYFEGGSLGGVGGGRGMQGRRGSCGGVCVLGFFLCWGSLGGIGCLIRRGIVAQDAVEFGEVGGRLGKGIDVGAVVEGAVPVVVADIDIIGGAAKVDAAPALGGPVDFYEGVGFVVDVAGGDAKGVRGDDECVAAMAADADFAERDGFEDVACARGRGQGAAFEVAEVFDQAHQGFVGCLLAADGELGKDAPGGSLDFGGQGGAEGRGKIVPAHGLNEFTVEVKAGRSELDVESDESGVGGLDVEVVGLVAHDGNRDGGFAFDAEDALGGGDAGDGMIFSGFGADDEGTPECVFGGEFLQGGAVGELDRDVGVAAEFDEVGAVGRAGGVVLDDLALVGNDAGFKLREVLERVDVVGEIVELVGGSAGIEGAIGLVLRRVEEGAVAGDDGFVVADFQAQGGGLAGDVGWCGGGCGSCGWGVWGGGAGGVCSSSSAVAGGGKARGGVDVLVEDDAVSPGLLWDRFRDGQELGACQKGWE